MKGASLHPLPFLSLLSFPPTAYSPNNIRFACVCPCYLLSFNFAFKRFAPFAASAAASKGCKKDHAHIQSDSMPLFPPPPRPSLSPASQASRLRAVVGVTRPCAGSLCVLSFFILRSLPPPTKICICRKVQHSEQDQNHHHQE